MRRSKVEFLVWNELNPTLAILIGLVQPLGLLAGEAEQRGAPRSC